MADHWTRAHTWGTFVVVAGIFLVGLFVPAEARLGGWLGELALLALFVALAGNGITGLWRGALVDERNMMSLSRLQLVLWTLVVLSGYFAAALSNVAAGARDPLSVGIPGDLWLLMGISTASLVGSPLLKGNRKQVTPNEKEKVRTWSLLAAQGKDTGGMPAPQGAIVVNAAPKDSRWADLFKGEETGNAALLDVAKVQMFFFTLILVLVYAIDLGHVLAGAQSPVTEFPEIPASMVALLGISHAGYLTSKAVPHSAPPGP